MSKPKQVIVLRKFPSLRTGKYCAQAAHASLLAFLRSGLNHKAQNPPQSTYVFSDPKVLLWLEEKFTKVCVYVIAEQDLLDLEVKAKEAGLPCALIQDCGDTEFKGVPTFTALAIGPAAPEVLDPITGHLPLF